MFTTHAEICSCTIFHSTHRWIQFIHMQCTIGWCHYTDESTCINGQEILNNVMVYYFSSNLINKDTLTSWDVETQSFLLHSRVVLFESLTAVFRAGLCVFLSRSSLVRFAFLLIDEWVQAATAREWLLSRSFRHLVANWLFMQICKFCKLGKNTRKRWKTKMCIIDQTRNNLWTSIQYVHLRIVIRNREILAPPSKILIVPLFLWRRNSSISSWSFAADVSTGKRLPFVALPSMATTREEERRRDLWRHWPQRPQRNAKKRSVNAKMADFEQVVPQT